MAPNPSSAGEAGEAGAVRRVHPLTVAAIVVATAALSAILLLLATPPPLAPSASTAASLPAVLLWVQASRGSETLSGGGIPGAPAHIVIAQIGDPASRAVVIALREPAWIP
jgi:hypothetical protein